MSALDVGLIAGIGGFVGGAAYAWITVTVMMEDELERVLRMALKGMALKGTPRREWNHDNTAIGILHGGTGGIAGTGCDANSDQYASDHRLDGHGKRVDFDLPEQKSDEYNLVDGRRDDHQ